MHILLITKLYCIMLDDVIVAVKNEINTDLALSFAFDTFTSLVIFYIFSGLYFPKTHTPKESNDWPSDKKLRRDH